MRRLFVIAAFLLLASVLSAQNPSAPNQPQSARQALIEMFFGTAANHMEKHLPDATRKTLRRMGSASGQDALAEFSMFSMQAKAMGPGFQTFDTGPTLLTAEDPRSGDAQRVEITVERDDLVGDEDQIELALHMTRNGKEDTTLPFIPRFTFIMKTESDVWRLNEISVTVRVPLADPDFLKRVEEQQRTQSEQAAQWSLKTVLSAQNAYHAANGSFACSLPALRRVSKESNGGRNVNVNMIADDLASGKRGGYVFAISGCDGSAYKVVAEPSAPDSGQRAFCLDESGAIRSAADGKATTCLSSGEMVQEALPNTAHGVIVANPGANAEASVPTGANSPRAVAVVPKVGVQRIRVSSGVSQGMVISRVSPVYPPEAKAARVQGQVVLQVAISKTGDVSNLRVVSGDPLLTPAAMDAVKQWKYKPYILNGNPVDVDTQVNVNFTLSEP
jgi:TonB family protein